MNFNKIGIKFLSLSADIAGVEKRRTLKELKLNYFN